MSNRVGIVATTLGSMALAASGALYYHTQKISEEASSKNNETEKSVQVLMDRITELETANKKLNLEEVRSSLIKKILPSTVTIKKPESSGGFSGGIIENRDGQYAVLTCGHAWAKQEDFLNKELEIIFPSGYSFKIMPKALPNGIVPWSSTLGNDLALILLPDNIQQELKSRNISGIPLVPFGQEPAVGDSMIIFGTPHGYRGSAAFGMVSAKRDFIWDKFTIRMDYQTDVAMNYGNSGGPAINMRGELIGVNSWGAAINGGGSIGLNFTISPETIRKVVDLNWGWNVLTKEERLQVNQQNALKYFTLPTPQNLFPFIVNNLASKS